MADVCNERIIKRHRHTTTSSVKVFHFSCPLRYTIRMLGNRYVSIVAHTHTRATKRSCATQRRPLPLVPRCCPLFLLPCSLVARWRTRTRKKIYLRRLRQAVALTKNLARQIRPVGHSVPRELAQRPQTVTDFSKIVRSAVTKRKAQGVERHGKDKKKRWTRQVESSVASELHGREGDDLVDSARLAPAWRLTRHMLPLSYQAYVESPDDTRHALAPVGNAPLCASSDQLRFLYCRGYR